MQSQPQMANVLTPNGQIQQIQIAQLANVQVKIRSILSLMLTIYIFIQDLQRICQ